MTLKGKTKEEFENWYIALANEKGCFEDNKESNISFEKRYKNFPKCEHPRNKRTYVGDNLLKCGICGKVFK